MLISRKLGGFLVYNFMKSWDGVRLPPINTVSIYSLTIFRILHIKLITYYIYHAQLSNSLRMEFLGDILKSHANECFDNFPEDLQVMIKDLDRM